MSNKEIYVDSELWGRLLDSYRIRLQTELTENDVIEIADYDNDVIFIERKAASKIAAILDHYASTGELANVD